MKELDFIKIIQDQTNSSYLGDDCAYLKELGIVVTQDNFIEDVHFKRDWATPYQIGYKAASTLYNQIYGDLRVENVRLPIEIIDYTNEA